MEKVRREQMLKGEQSRNSEMEVYELSEENKMLRSKLEDIEIEKANLKNDKERKDRECKSL